MPIGTVAVADKRTASVIVTAGAETIARARHLVDALDAPSSVLARNVHSTSISLRYAKPSEAVKALKAIVPDAAILADDRSNTVVINAAPDTIETVRSLLDGVDKPGRQVLFEVRVTDVKPTDDSSNVGIQFGGSGFGAGAVAQFPYTLTKSSIEVNAQINALVQSGHAQILAHRALQR